jgi:general secretion pathway protein G
MGCICVHAGSGVGALLMKDELSMTKRGAPWLCRGGYFVRWGAQQRRSREQVMGAMPSLIEVTRGSETVIVDPGAVVGGQHRGKSHFIHPTGGAITISRDLALVEFVGVWRKLKGEPAKPSNLFSSPSRAAFSLVELVIVVAIIAIIAAIALPRLSHQSEKASTNAIQHDQAVLQAAIERYRAEHGTYPSAAGIADQLTKFSDANGGTNDTQVGLYIYGPYVRKVPPMPMGPARGRSTIAGTAGAGVAWIYDPVSGEIRGNVGP